MTTIPPLLDVRSCSGLRGPWKGTLNVGSTTNVAPQNISFTLNQASNANLAGTATGTYPDSGRAPGSTYATTVTWNIPVHLTTGPTPTARASKPAPAPPATARPR